MANSKDVVVTGVSTGIGWGTTKVLVSKGFRVFGSVRKQGDADHLEKEFDNGFVPLLMDITDADAVHQAAQKVGSMIGDSRAMLPGGSPEPAVAETTGAAPQRKRRKFSPAALRRMREAQRQPRGALTTDNEY